VEVGLMAETGGSAPGRRRLSTSSAAGVVAAAVIAVSANVLAARFYERWDWTSAGLYTLSPATLETLHGLSEPIEVVVLLSSSGPLTASVRHMLAAYGAETARLQVRWLDPDRSPAEFLATQQKYEIRAGKTEHGRVVTDASIIVARGERHWFITTDDIVVYDEQDGRARPKLEQALTEGIRNVLDREQATLCVASGHREISLDDGGPNGLAELKFRFQKNNYEVKAVELAERGKKPELGACAALIVAGPEIAFEKDEARPIEEYLRAGGNVLVAVNPMLDDDGRLTPVGLDGVLALAGMELAGDFVIERREQAVVPQGVGETFFAVPKEHAITKGMVHDEPEKRIDVLVSIAQSVRPKPSGSPAPLLQTSEEAFSVRDIRPFTEEGKKVEKGPGDASGPFTLAMAAELPKPSGSKAPHGPRLVALGTSNPLWNEVWRQPSQLGARRFAESLLAWLTARPAIVSVPEKPAQEVGLALTEESLGEVMRYVLLYMPVMALICGGLTLWRRRQSEKRSREPSRPRAEPKASGEDGAPPE
jgi:hypothetical protein